MKTWTSIRSGATSTAFTRSFSRPCYVRESELGVKARTSTILNKFEKFCEDASDRLHVGGDSRKKFADHLMIGRSGLYEAGLGFREFGLVAREFGGVVEKVLQEHSRVAEPATGPVRVDVGSTDSYTAQAVDTLSGVADRQGTTVAALVGANGLADAEQIEIGQRLSLAGGEARPSPRPKAPAPPVQKPPVKEAPARPEEGARPEIHRSGPDRRRYYFLSLAELDADRLSVLTRQDCPTYGTSYERIELNCRTAEFRYIGDAGKVA